ncbi:MAG: glycosyltransferase family 39 protein [Thiomonas arsenitoxydans]|uniref:Glycosyltransferase family 39 protein n=1 Tax=Thiomonas arsenitoxydans (strain DSM 22701 / CIP 110005 / 3As) TaxID=426114 RepID=A0A8I1SW11_THIA3|nr:MULTISPECIES: glycosyltransferase family 39 protein [Thiomonas]MBN8744907.1 glycosyltransferase family 39 protein [Thiomonas arsenitoxydans]ODU91677.1 MAG: glycosyl transferase [Thiomonas sp. SCN 64-16]
MSQSTQDFSDSDTGPGRGLTWLMFAALVVLWLGTLGWRDLVPTDEGRYAEIPREMVVTGDWVTPRLDGFKYFEKPPLQYWATAVTYEVFGFGEWQARLWTGLTGLLTVLFTGWAGTRLFNRRTGVFAACVLASMFYWNAMSHINTLDMGTAATMSASLMAFLLAQRPGANRAQTRWWMWACWAFMALAVLSKGLIGILLPGAALVLYTLIYSDWKLWTRLYIVSGLLIFLAIAAPWFVWVQARNPEFFDYFFIYQQFTRFLTSELKRPGPWWYFFPILILGVLPWLGSLVPALWRGAARPAQRGAAFGSAQGRTLHAQGMLVIWAVFIFVFFSISKSKLPSYILPIFPAIALLIGDYLDRARPRVLRWQFALLALLGLAAVIGFTQLHRLGNATTPGALYQQFGWWLEGTAAAALISGLVAWRWEAQGRRTAAVLLVSVAMTLGFSLGIQQFQILGRTASTKDVVHAIRPWILPGQPFYAVGTYDQTLPFYLDRTVTLVEYQGELHFGITQQPGLWVPTYADFARRWNEDKQPLALMSPFTLPALQALHMPMTVIYRAPRFIVIAKPGQDYGAAAQSAAAHLPADWNAGPSLVSPQADAGAQR